MREFARGPRGDPRRRGEAGLPRDVRQGHRSTAAPDRPRVVGKRDEEEPPAASGRRRARRRPDRARHRQRLARKVAHRLGRGAHPHLDELKRRAQAASRSPARPFFCSGCPHNRSTVVPEGSVAAAGIGCHGMAMGMDRGIIGVTHMGGEGAQWVGIAPFTETPHLFQNIGDGTFFHSGGLALNYAVAVRRQHHLQDPLQLRGGDDGRPGRGGRAADPRADAAARGRGRQADHRHHRRPREVQGRRARRATRRSGTATASIEAQSRAARPSPASPCSSTTSSARPRSGGCASAASWPTRRRACSSTSACARGAATAAEVELPVASSRSRPSSAGRRRSTSPPATRTTRACSATARPSSPSSPSGGAAEEGAAPDARWTASCPSPRSRCPRRASPLHMMGIGGTGVVTVNQILGTAAMLDGKHVRGPRPDRAQPEGRAGGLATSRSPRSRSSVANKVSAGGADLYLGFDLLVATDPGNLDKARVGPHDRGRVDEPDPDRPDGAGHRGALPRAERHAAWASTGSRGRTRTSTSTRSAMAEALFDDHMAINLILLGAAYQAGALPISRRVHRARHPAQRRLGGDEPARVPVGPDGGGGRRAGRGRGRSGPRRGAVEARACCPPRRAALVDAGGRDGRAAAAPRDPGARADRVPERGLRAASTSTSSRRVAAEEERRGARAHRARGGGGAPPLQAHGLQGRVRGGAAAPRRGARGRARAREFGRAIRVLLAPAPAAAPRARAQEEDPARRLVRARLPGAPGACGGCAARRSTSSATREVRRVERALIGEYRGAGRDGARAALARHPRPRPWPSPSCPT